MITPIAGPAVFGASEFYEANGAPNLNVSAPLRYDISKALLEIPAAGTSAGGYLTHLAQTIGGVKTFADIPTCATAPGSNNQLANKAYVDSRISTGLSWKEPVESFADVSGIAAPTDHERHIQDTTTGPYTKDYIYEYDATAPGWIEYGPPVEGWALYVRTLDKCQLYVVDGLLSAWQDFTISLAPNAVVDTLKANGTTAATSASTGTVIVAGGIGVGGDSVFGAKTTIASTVAGQLAVNYSSTAGATFSADVNGNLTITPTAALKVVGPQTITYASTNPALILAYDATNFTTFVQSSTGDLTIDASGSDINFHSTDVVRVQNTTASSSTSTGALVVSGGAAFAGALRSTGLIKTTATTASTSNLTGALQVSGGAGIAGAVFIGGALKVESTATSISTSTGAVIVAGGAGVAGDVNSGGNLAVVSKYFGPALKPAIVNTWYMIYEQTAQNYDGISSSDLWLDLTIYARAINQMPSKYVVSLTYNSSAVHSAFITDQMISPTARSPDIYVYRDSAATNTTIAVYLRWPAGGHFALEANGAAQFIRYGAAKTSLGVYLDCGTDPAPNNLTFGTAPVSVLVSNRTNYGLNWRGSQAIDSTGLIQLRDLIARPGITLVGSSGTVDITVGNGIVVVVPTGSVQAAYYSTDGINWNYSPSTFTASTLGGCAYNWNTGVFCIAGYFYCYTSTDGINWSEHSSILGGSNYAYTNARRMVCDGIRFYGLQAVALDPKVFYSSDGIDWTDATGDTLVGDVDIDVDVVKRIYIVVSSSSGKDYLRSVNGTAFTKILNGLDTGAWMGVGYGGGIWITVSAAGLISRSTDDGLTFTQVHDAGITLTQPYYYNPRGRSLPGGIWFVGSDGGGQNIVYSYDMGDTWGTFASGGSLVRAITYFRGKLLIGRGPITPYFINLQNEALSVIGNADLTGNIDAGSMHAGSMLIDGDYSASSSTSGTLQVIGGAGITGNLFLGGSSAMSNLSLSGTTDSTSTSTGSLIVAGGAGIGGNISAATMRLSGAVSSTYYNAGDLITAGGVGIGENLNVFAKITQGQGWQDLQLLPITKTGPNSPGYTQIGTTGLYCPQMQVNEVLYANAQTPHGATGTVRNHVHFCLTTAETDPVITYTAKIYAWKANAHGSSSGYQLYDSVDGVFNTAGALAAWDTRMISWNTASLAGYLPSALLMCRLILKSHTAASTVYDVAIMGWDMHFQLDRLLTQSENADD